MYNGKEVKGEIKAKNGDKNVLVECKMEPSFPLRADVDWSPKPQKDGNVSWILNKTSYALHFEVVHTDDAGDYTCTVKRTGVSLVGGKVQIKGTSWILDRMGLWCFKGFVAIKKATNICLATNVSRVMYTTR